MCWVKPSRHGWRRGSAVYMYSWCLVVLPCISDCLLYLYHRAQCHLTRHVFSPTGGYLPPEEIKERFDSNCITPVRLVLFLLSEVWSRLWCTCRVHDWLVLCVQGTEFMDNLAQCLRYYVADRLSNDPGWRNVTVSDAQAFRAPTTTSLLFPFHELCSFTS